MSEYIVKDEIRTDSARLLTEKEVCSIINFRFNSVFCNIKIQFKLTALSKKYKDCEIRFENKTIKFDGYKDDVLNAKTEILMILNDKVNSKNNEYEEQMHISKNVQWLYEQDKEWKPFPLYLNSMIENAHEKKLSLVFIFCEKCFKHYKT